ncbi:ABC transporter F family member 4-like [Papaver somniferum]|uniref:ABC transporter F family member 4-like n=1 Tax=Papaver somniferum TaxID=3469 RepID=UPI000E6F53EA|nr:ABC transporter F family member 4-like [Papaver somniferum]
MTPNNEQGFPSFLRWVISDISTTIEKDINEAMKKEKACSDEQQQILDEYGKNRQENNTDALKELHRAQTRRDEVLEELSDLQVKHEKLVSFIKEKSKKLHAADLSNVQNDKDLVDLCVDTLQEIISFNKTLKSEDERDDDKQEEEEGEKVEKSGKGGDVDDSDDDGSDDDDDEKGEKGKKGRKGGDLDDDDSDDDEEEEEEGSKGGDEEDRTESEKNEVSSETPKKPSSPSSNTNEGNEEKDMEDGSEYDKVVDSETANKPRPLSKSNKKEDGKDGTSLGVESETANKPSTSLPKTNEDQQDHTDLDNQDVRNTTQTAEIDEATIIAVQSISHVDPKGMLPVEEDVLLLTQGEDPHNDPYTSIDDFPDNLSETVFKSLKKVVIERHHLK